MASTRLCKGTTERDLLVCDIEDAETTLSSDTTGLLALFDERVLRVVVVSANGTLSVDAIAYVVDMRENVREREETKGKNAIECGSPCFIDSSMRWAERECESVKKERVTD